MADIFLSYSRQDNEQAERLARALSSLGYEVWWDADLPNGVSWRRKIEKELELAVVVLVLWSRSARESDSVTAEAAFAKDAGKYTAVILDETRPRLEFSQLQFDDLRKWNGEPNTLRRLRFFKKLPRLNRGRPATSNRSMSNLRDWAFEVAVYGLLSAAVRSDSMISASGAATLKYLLNSNRTLSKAPIPVMNKIGRHVDRELEANAQTAIDRWLDVVRARAANKEPLRISLFGQIVQLSLAGGELTESKRAFIKHAAWKLRVNEYDAHGLIDVLLVAVKH